MTNTKTYVDFDLHIERSDDKYRARVLNSPSGPASSEFSLPFTDDKLENFILRISQGRRRVRKLNPVDVDVSREFGTALFQAVFDGDIGGCLSQSIAAINPDTQSLRLRLRLSDAPELVDIPWEYLYDATNRRFLALSVDTPLVRYLDLSGSVTPLAVTSPLKVLVVISSPSDVIGLDVEEEWKKLKGAVAGLEAAGLIRLERLETATLDELQRQLRRNQYHIFHFIGHGGFDPITSTGALMMEDESGRGRLVSGQTLGTLLHDEKTLRLAVLNACEGGRTSKSDPFAGVGQSLLLQGIPAVIAMQFEVTDQSAIELTNSFYAALTDGYPVEAALTEARKSIFARNELEWGTPVLYMRAANGQIFDLTTVTERPHALSHTTPTIDGHKVIIPETNMPPSKRAAPTAPTSAAAKEMETLAKVKQSSTWRRTIGSAIAGGFVVFAILIAWALSLPDEPLAAIPSGTLAADGASSTSNAFSATSIGEDSEALIVNESLAPVDEVGVASEDILPAELDTYFPAAPNLTWEYAGMIDGTEYQFETNITRYTIHDRELPEDGLAIFEFNTYDLVAPKDLVVSTRYYWSGDILYIDDEVDLFGTGIDYEPDLELAWFPLTEGEEWEWSGTLDAEMTVDGFVTVAFVGYERMETPQSSFDTLHLHVDLMFDGVDGLVPFREQDIWLAKGYGIVRQQTTYILEEQTVEFDLGLSNFWTKYVE